MWEERIVVDSKILVGKPVVKGTRLAVDFILDLLAQGWPPDEILRNYPSLEAEDIQACLAYARDTSRKSENGKSIIDNSQVITIDRHHSITHND